MMTLLAGDPVALVERSGVVESQHTGHVIVLAPDGSVRFTLGRPGQPVFSRSCMKPLQALAMLRLGFDGNSAEIALACASHSGSALHTALIEQSLESVGLQADDLQCPPDLPIGTAELRAHLASRGAPSRLAMNCSGKHAAMLRTCLVNSWPISDYLSPAHPLQTAIAETVADLAGEPVAAAGVDGCGAPVLAVSLTALARGFALIASAPGSARGGNDCHILRAAMRANPELVAGPQRLPTELMRVLPGLIAKDGAEGCFAAALADGGAVAVKIDDGAMRAAEVAAVAGLRRLGVRGEVLDRFGVIPVLGGGRRVGEVRAVF